MGPFLAVDHQVSAQVLPGIKGFAAALDRAQETVMQAVSSQMLEAVALSPEPFGAALQRAGVASFPGMDAVMSPQAGGVGEPFATARAGAEPGFFSGMGPHVAVQGAVVDKACQAALDWAQVRLFTAVQPVVGGQALLFFEPLVTAFVLAGKRTRALEPCGRVGREKRGQHGRTPLAAGNGPWTLPGVFPLQGDQQAGQDVQPVSVAGRAAPASGRPLSFRHQKRLPVPCRPGPAARPVGFQASSFGAGRAIIADLCFCLDR